MSKVPTLVAVTGDGEQTPARPTPSIFDPVFLGLDEFGLPVRVPVIYKNMLTGGEPGAGKSGLLNNVVAHAALSTDCELCLLDGKRVELGQWRRCAKLFVGPDLELAVRTLRRLQQMMDNRYDYLESLARRKIDRSDGFKSYVIPVDEVAYFSATVGDKKLRETFAELLRDLVARGRAVGIIVIAATQRPSSDIIPTSLRDLFAWRMAFRCTTDVSSDIVLGHGWKDRGWSANTISPNNPGKALLIAENGSPQFVKAAYLSDTDCARIAAYAAYLRAEARQTSGKPVLRSVA